MSIYLENVKKSIFRNLRWHIKEYPGDKEKWLKKVIKFCEKLLADENEPREPRKRIRAGKKFYTRR